MGDDQLLMGAPAVERARRFGSAQTIEGTSCIEGGGQPPIRPAAGLIALLCVGSTSIWGFVFVDPDMPSLDPLIHYSWFIPTSPLFPAVWLLLTLSMAASFYVVLRSPHSAARSAAVVAYIASFILQSLWAWLIFGPRTPITGLYVMIAFVACVIASLWLSARVDRKATLLMAPYVSWVAFILSVTIRLAREVSWG
jgi:tryptophan-rich sensory protein